MSDLPPYPDTGDDTGMGLDGGSTTGTPRWVKVFGIIALVVVLLVAIMLLTGGGGHGPGRHTGDAGGNTPPSSVTEDHTPSGDLGGNAPPEGGR